MSDNIILKILETTSGQPEEEYFSLLNETVNQLVLDNNWSTINESISLASKMEDKGLIDYLSKNATTSFVFSHNGEEHIASIFLTTLFLKYDSKKEGGDLSAFDDLNNYINTPDVLENLENHVDSVFVRRLFSVTELASLEYDTLSKVARTMALNYIENGRESVVNDTLESFVGHQEPPFDLVNFAFLMGITIDKVSTDKKDVSLGLNPLFKSMRGADQSVQEKNFNAKLEQAVVSVFNGIDSAYVLGAGIYQDAVNDYCVNYVRDMVSSLAEPIIIKAGVQRREVLVRAKFDYSEKFADFLALSFEYTNGELIQGYFVPYTWFVRSRIEGSLSAWLINKGVDSFIYDESLDLESIAKNLPPKDSEPPTLH